MRSRKQLASVPNSAICRLKIDETQRAPSLKVLWNKGTTSEEDEVTANYIRMDV